MLAFTYRGSTRQVTPHQLFHEGGHWYLRATPVDAAEVRTYRIDRFEGTALDSHESGDEAPGPPAPAPEPLEELRFRPWEFGDGESTTATVRVDAAVAPIVLAADDALAVAEREPDGTVVMQLEVRDRQGLWRFLLALLDHAELLSPPELRDDLRGPAARPRRGGGVSRPTDAERVALILSVVPWLAARDGARLSEIAEHFGAEPAALFRDLRAVSAGPEPEVGFYIQISIEADDDGDDGDDDDDLGAEWVDPWDADASTDPVLTAQIHDYYFQAPPQLDRAEALRLLVAGAAYRDIPGFEALGPALDKLAAALGPGAERAVQVDLGRSRAETLALAREAAGTSTPLALTYYSSGRDEVSRRTVEPWALRSRGGHWYLSGHCRDTDDLRHFRVDRILEATPAGEPGSFRAPEGVEEPLTGMAEGGRPVRLDLPAEDAWMLGSDPVESRVERGDRVVVVMRSHGEAWLDRLLLTLGPSTTATDLDTGRSLAPGGPTPPGGCSPATARSGAAPERGYARPDGPQRQTCERPLRDRPLRGRPRRPRARRAGAERPRPRHGQVSPARNALEWVVVIVGAVLVALLVRNFVVQSFRIPSPSMHPTLLEGDRVLVNRLSYKLHDVNRGDVIVFERPDTAPAGPDEPNDLIKRVVALPGETVVARDGVVYVDDKPLDEPYLPDTTSTDKLDKPVTVPEGEVFVMGDNRSNSSDSRYIGTIPIDTIVGRAFAIIWPFSRISGL